MSTTWKQHDRDIPLMLVARWVLACGEHPQFKRFLNGRAGRVHHIIGCIG